MIKAKLFLGAAVFFGAAFLFAPTALALTIRSGNEIVIPKGETVDGTLVVAGQAVTVDGDVRGDIICAGQTVVINGIVDGDVVCAGQNVTVTNSVAGSVRAAGQALNIGGSVGRNVTVAGQSVKSDSRIQGEMMFASQSAAVGGQVGKSVAGAASSITVSGNIGGDAQFKNHNLTVKNGAVIAGGLVYESGNEAVFESGSRVAGEVRRSIPPAGGDASVFSRPQETVQQKIFDKIRDLAIYLAVALLFVFFFKKQALKAADAMLVRPGKTFGLGLLFLILVPIAAIAIMITIIGIPVALIVALLYIAAILFSSVLTAIAIGRKLAQNYYKSKSDSLLIHAVIGVVGLWVFSVIPVIGGIISLAAVIWGLGGIYHMFRREKINPVNPPL